MDFAAWVSDLDGQIKGWAAAMGWPLEGMLRLALAMLAGGLVGLEREVRGREAGFRTNLLVCLGSALVMLVSIHFASYPWQSIEGVDVRVDPARIAYGVMTGIGFLGAGAIVHYGGGVRGLTTAAALWCVAAMGLSIGFGQYLLAATSVVLVVTALWVLDLFEGVLPHVRYRTITIRRTWAPGVVGQTIDRIRAAGLGVVEADFRRVPEEQYRSVDVELRVSFMNPRRYYMLHQNLSNEPDFELLSACDE